VYTHRYRIIVSGGLGEITREAFLDFDIERIGRNRALTGDLDRPGLGDALAIIRDLALELVGIVRPPQPDASYRVKHVNGVGHGAPGHARDLAYRNR
jgi:hypothetical protein